MIKQVIVIRKDLKMRRGKEIAQASHASSAFLSLRALTEEKITKIQKEWLKGDHTKICLCVNSEEELFRIHEEAIDLGIESHLVRDLGKTEFKGQITPTCCAIGPDYAHKIDKITKDLKCY